MSPGLRGAPLLTALERSRLELVGKGVACLGPASQPAP